MPGHRTLALIVAAFGFALLCLTGSGAAREVEITLPMSVPRFDGLTASLPAPDGGAAIEIDLALGYDESGKVVAAGPCSVDGAAVAVKGAVKSQRGDVTYVLSLKGIGEKLAVKMAGALRPGPVAAAVKYSGPRGKASGETSALALQAAGVISSIRIDPVVDAKGKIGGAASIADGFGGAGDALLAGKLAGDKLSLSIKSGKRKLSFKGARAAAGFVGLVKWSLPPDKGTAPDFTIEDFTIAPPTPGGGGAVTLEPIVSPTAESSVFLRGAASANAVIDIVNDTRAQRVTAQADGRFSAFVELFSNRINRLYLTATPPGGAPSAPVTADVIQDSEGPALHIDEPLDGSETLQETIAVAGRVSDMLSGFLGLEVEVNGLRAEVDVGIGTNGTFERAGIALEPGFNFIEVVARDRAGNTSFAGAAVRRVEPPASAPRLSIAAGAGQRGRIGALLPQPVAVELVEASGAPFAGKLVRFEVTRSDGRIYASTLSSPDDGALVLDVRTDAAGLARVHWRLGSDAGCGNNRLRVTSAGVPGSALVCASATAAAPARILVGSGNDQRLEAGAPAAEVLRAWVTDGCNGAAGVPVRFTVTGGGGKVGGAESIEAMTTITGHAEVRFTAGADGGPQTIEATFEGNQGPPAVFAAMATARGAGPTRFEGVVLDNASTPLGGAPVALVFPGKPPIETETTDDGRFAFEDLQGSGFAVLLVAGTAAKRLGGQAIASGSFPPLAFETVIVPNATNTLAGPVLLPPLIAANARIYDGTRDVELTCEGIDGLVMRVRAGSMRRGDGSSPSPSDPATLSLNQVHVDNIPMPLPDGAAAPFAWTLQPGGARFDPPIEIEFPNMAGLPAGAIAYFLSYNHDTYRFDIVASGHVDAGGAVIRSDPGSGISIAGWGGLCPPYPVTGTVEYQNCVDIQATKVVGGDVPNGSYLCKDQGERIAMQVSLGPACQDEEITWTIVPGAAGTFENGVATGPSVVFVQSDGFFSSSLNDVEIRARAGTAEGRIQLTVFHVQSDSGILFRNTTRDFPSKVFPSQADQNLVASFMNQFIANTGFKTREYAAAAPGTQPEVTGVITDVEFFVEDEELWIRVTSGDTPDDVNVTFETFKLLHREHMTVLDADIEITEVWSDQFPGIRANALPGKSGAKNYPYILMGQRADEVTHVGATVLVNDIPADLEDQILVRLSLQALLTGDFEPAGEADVSQSGNVLTVALRHSNFALETFSLGAIYRIVAGVDFDEDGTLQAEEIGAEFGGGPPAHLKVVSQNLYDANRDFFLTGAALATNVYPVAAEFLKAFAAGQTPQGVTVEQESIGINDLDHNVGALFTAGGQASIDRYIYPPGSLASQKVLASQELENFVLNICQFHRLEVLDFFANNDTGGFSHEFTFEFKHGPNRNIIFGQDQDLFRALGTASSFGTIKLLVDDEAPHQLLSVEFDGHIYDLYDWDFSGGGFLDDRAATVQAGYGTLGFGGGVFSSKILLQTTIFSLSFNFGT